MVIKYEYGYRRHQKLRAGEKGKSKERRSEREGSSIQLQQWGIQRATGRIIYIFVRYRIPYIRTQYITHTHTWIDT